MEKNKVWLKKPQDHSVKAFREWVQAIRFAMTGSRDVDTTMTEADWAKSCKEFWSKEPK